MSRTPWDDRYDTEDYRYGTAPNDFLVEAVAGLPRGRALTLAEGEGRNAVFLAEQGYDVLGVDSSAVGLEKAQRLALERGVVIRTETRDLAGLTIEPESYSLVVSIFCHVPPPVRRELHRKVITALQPGGALVLEAFTPRQLELRTGGPPVAELMMTLAGLREELSGLELVHAVELERDVVEGDLHHGRGAVVQIIGRKPAAGEVTR